MRNKALRIADAMLGLPPFTDAGLPDTPTIEPRPVRDGYVFLGWARLVTPSVTPEQAGWAEWVVKNLREE